MEDALADNTVPTKHNHTAAPLLRKQSLLSYCHACGGLDVSSSNRYFMPAVQADSAHAMTKANTGAIER
jgi:hypothetical protein